LSISRISGLNAVGGEGGEFITPPGVRRSIKANVSASSWVSTSSSCEAKAPSSARPQTEYRDDAWSACACSAARCSASRAWSHGELGSIDLAPVKGRRAQWRERGGRKRGAGWQLRKELKLSRRGADPWTDPKTRHRSSASSTQEGQRNAHNTRQHNATRHSTTQHCTKTNKSQHITTIPMVAIMMVMVMAPALVTVMMLVLMLAIVLALRLV